MAQIINIEEIPTRHDPWSYSDDGENWIFESYSPAGENLVIEGCFSWFGKDAIFDLARYLFGIYQDFDSDDHAAGWYGANMGEPDSLRDLVDDAEAIEEMYKDLADYMARFAKGTL